jgi:outer membrane protein assembly factor BamB
LKQLIIHPVIENLHPQKMNTRIVFSCSLLLAGIILSCEKQNEKIASTLNVAGIRSSTNFEIVNVELKSGTVTANPVECYLMGSTLFDPNTGGFGYIDCHSRFNLIDPLTGDTIKSFTVPGFLSQTVLDSVDNMLIGHCYEEGANYVYKINMETGDIMARNPVDFGPGVYACVYFYRAPEKEYILMRADSVMISINPENGEILHSVKAATNPGNAYYCAKDNLLIGLTYSVETDQNYVVTLDAETGELLRNVQIQERNNYYMCVSGYDSETGCYILVTPENRILFIDIASGEIKESYETDFQIQEFKFWRGRNNVN